MVSVETTYKILKMDLDLEAEDHGGVISRKVLDQIISVKIGSDARTSKNKVKQLVDGRILVPLNQHSFQYQPNGFAKKAEKEGA